MSERKLAFWIVCVVCFTLIALSMVISGCEQFAEQQLTERQSLISTNQVLIRRWVP